MDTSEVQVCFYLEARRHAAPDGIVVCSEQRDQTSSACQPLREGYVGADTVMRRLPDRMYSDCEDNIEVYRAE